MHLFACLPLLWSQVFPSGSGINKGMDSLGKVICFPVLAKVFLKIPSHSGAIFPVWQGILKGIYTAQSSGCKTACFSRNTNRSQKSIENGELHPLLKFIHIPLSLQDYEKNLCASRDLV